MCLCSLRDFYKRFTFVMFQGLQLQQQQLTPLSVERIETNKKNEIKSAAAGNQFPRVSLHSIQPMNGADAAQERRGPL